MLYDNVLLKLEKPKEEVLSSGLIMVQTIKPKYFFGTVVECGTGKISKAGVVQPLGVQKGERVAILKNCGELLTMDNEEYLLIKEDDILFIVED